MDSETYNRAKDLALDAIRTAFASDLEFRDFFVTYDGGSIRSLSSTIKIDISPKNLEANEITEHPKLNDDVVRQGKAPAGTRICYRNRTNVVQTGHIMRHGTNRYFVRDINTGIVWKIPAHVCYLAPKEKK